MRIAVIVAVAILSASGSHASCSATSGPHTTALAELYTSERCHACPAADRWLSSSASRYSRTQLVPLALLVDYSDYLLRKDPGVEPALFQRQRRLLPLQRIALVYTPRVLLQGAEVSGWDDAEFDAAVARIIAMPPRAQIALTLMHGAEEGVRVQVEAQGPAGLPERALAVFVAAYEAGSDRNLALEWKGPYPLARRELTVGLLPGSRWAASGVAAFVQNRRTGEVLQSLMLGPCAPQTRLQAPRPRP